MRTNGLRVVLGIALAAVLTLAGAPPSARAANPATGTASLTVTVLGWTSSSWGKPVHVGDATVSVTRAGKKAIIGTAITAWGTAEATIENLPAGVLLDIHVAAEGFLPGQQQVTLTAGQNTHIWEFSIYEPSSVRGTVVDTEGAPIPAAKVTVFDAVSGGVLGEARADSTGAFLVSGLVPGTGRVRGTAPHYLTNWADSEGQLTWDISTGFQLPPGGVLEDGSPTPAAHLVLAREAVLTGRVFGKGRPLRNAKVTVYDPLTDQVLRTAMTNRSGRFRVDRISAWGGRHVIVSASKPGWKTQWAESPSRTRYGTKGYWLTPGDVLDITGQNSHTFDLRR
jgi:carboxypeptidase family protein